MLPYLKFVFMMLSILSFGFSSLSILTNIRSIVLLIPLSFSFGIASYIFICHVISFIVGPQLASVLTVFILLLAALTIFIFNLKVFQNLEKELTKKQLLTITLTGLVICILTFLAIFRFGTFDKEFHFQLALTLLHNNVYPPRDYYRPDYVLLYHYGGDLFAGAIYHFCNLDISRAYELMSTILSGTTFLSFFALAYLLTKSFKVTYIASICAYFGGGLLWLDALIRCFLKLLPKTNYEWGFLETFFNIGMHGGIIDAPSLFTFLSTTGLGNPLLILSFILFWKMLEERSIKTKVFYIFFLNVSLFSLFMSAEWMYLTFLAGILPFLFSKLIKKQIFVSALILLVTSILLSKTLGNALFLQDDLQSLGRANIFNAGIKEKLFWVMSWGRLSDIVMNYREVYAFSWEFLSEFGLSLILSPIALFYLIKTKNNFALILFFCSIFTMPVPLIIDFKINPVDFNRLFAFGNTMLILLITCGISILFKSFFEKNFLVFIYLTAFCLSPVSALLGAGAFSPHIYNNKTFAHELTEGLKNIKSTNGLKILFTQLNNEVIKHKNKPVSDFKDEIKFLKQNSKPMDVAISSSLDIPCYAGIYSIIPAKKWLYKDLIYSFYDSIFLTTFTTLDPYLLDELNIKWILISKNSKNNLPKETQEFLNNPEMFSLVYTSHVQTNDPKENYEIYHVNNLRNILSKFTRKTGWLLVDKNGQPIEVGLLKAYQISIFPSSKEALAYLNNLHGLRPFLKNELITAQATVIENLENQIKRSGAFFILNKKI